MAICPPLRQSLILWAIALSPSPGVANLVDVIVVPDKSSLVTMRIAPIKKWRNGVQVKTNNLYYVTNLRLKNPRDCPHS